MVYGLGLQRQLGGHFIAAIQSILHRLADVSISLDRGMKLDLQRPTNTLSRVAASLHILLHLVSLHSIIAHVRLIGMTVQHFGNSSSPFLPSRKEARKP